jgi:ferrous-iron efflux pump FieF
MTEETPANVAASSISPEKRASLMRLATYASVTVAAVLILVKFGAWVVTDSVSLLSTLIDSLMDVAASLINLFAVRHALQPADQEHRFGHGKAEPLSGLAQAAFISGSAAFLLIEAAKRIFNPKSIENSDIGLAIMVFAICTTVILVIFQKYVVRRTGSVAIAADSLHYQADILVNASVIVSLLLAAELGWSVADPLFAIAIAAYIVWGAWRIAHNALDQLMDHELPPEDRRRIYDIATKRAGVSDLHDLRTRTSGTQVFIQLHLEMDGKMPLREAHEISDQVMFDVQNAFPNAEVLIHEDPEELQEEHAVLERQGKVAN